MTDTPESVRFAVVVHAENVRVPTKILAMLENYAALLERLNQPVSNESVAKFASNVFPNNMAHKSDYTRIKTALEAHMAALRAELPK